VRPINKWWGSNSAWRSSQDRGVAETTERVRQLVDGIEGAVAAGDDLELARYLASPALSRFLEATAARRAVHEKWLPARAGLCWSRSDRAPGAPGRFWLRLRFEDRTQVQGPTRRVTAATVVHEVEVELDTTEAPWRLCEVEELFAP
jgi:hypothetical protein